VDECRPHGKPRERLLEARLDEVGDGVHAVPADAAPAHAGVDRQKPGRVLAAFPDPPFDRATLGERGNEPRAACRGQLVGKHRREDDHGPLDAGGAELLTFGDGRDTESPRRQRLERARDGDRPEAVRIGLHHREQRHASAVGERRPISLERAEVDLDPGAQRLRPQLTCHSSGR
jgi:hypothetical protein